jgi:hypothetical protein
MTFKKWLIKEEASGGDTGSSFFYGLQLYPTDAFDFTPASSHPAEHWFLQSRWETERKDGRKFHNIDEPEFQRRGYVSVSSSDLPGAGSGFWKHKANNKSYLKVHKEESPTIMAISKSGLEKNAKLTTVNDPLIIDVDKIFGDKGTGKPQQLSASFDKPWTKVYEMSNPFGYDVIGQGTTGINNTGMGIRSKYVGPDDTGEGNDKEPVKKADFGMERRRKMKKYQRKHK